MANHCTKNDRLRNSQVRVMSLYYTTSRDKCGRQVSLVEPMLLKSAFELFDADIVLKGILSLKPVSESTRDSGTKFGAKLSVVGIEIQRRSSAHTKPCDNGTSCTYAFQISLSGSWTMGFVD